MNAKLVSQYARVIIDAPLLVLDYRIPESMSLITLWLMKMDSVKMFWRRYEMPA